MSSAAHDRSDIDALGASFNGLFDNRRGLSPLLGEPTKIFCADAVIRRRADGSPLSRG